MLHLFATTQQHATWDKANLLLLQQKIPFQWRLRAWDKVPESHHLLRLKITRELLAAILTSHLPISGQYSVGGNNSSSPVLRGGGK
jgi:hypothetical protein